MRFPPAFLDEIRTRVSISSLVGRTVRWDRRKTQSSRGDWWACCPFHDEKSPSFHADDRKGRYHCFGCKASGDIFTFLVEKEGLSFPEAVERLAAEAGLPMPAVSPAEAEREERRASLYDVMEEAARFFEAQLDAKAGREAKAYLEGRSLTGEVAKAFRLGYAPGSRYDLKSHLADKGVDTDRMIEAGLLVTGEDIAVPYDRFRDRVMFPIRDARGRVIAFGGRALSSAVAAKYLNSPETPLFHKGDTLYNLDRARGPAFETASVIAVEGYVDVIAMTRAGLANTVAPLGTALTENQLRMLWKLAPEPLLCFDGDPAGVKAAHRALDLALPLLEPGKSLSFVFLPGGLDPDDLLKSAGPEAVRQAVRAGLPLSQVLWERALERNDRATPERRARFEADLETEVARIANPKVRAHYATEMRFRLKELFRPSGFAPARPRGPGAGPAAAPFRRVRLSDRPGKPGNRRFRDIPAWEIPAPPSAELRAASAGAALDAAARERREHLIVAAILNHPALAGRHAETLADLPLSGAALDSLKGEILDTAALDEGLDAEKLSAHLKRRGHEAAIAEALATAGRLNVWFVMPDAALDDADTGLRQMVTLYRKSVTLDRDLKAAERLFAEDPSDGNLERLNEIREELRSSAGSEALIEGFGAASGRPSGPVM